MAGVFQNDDEEGAREGLQTFFRPEQRVVVLARFAVDLCDLQVAVRA
jgi:hypothetical protein